MNNLQLISDPNIHKCLISSPTRLNDFYEDSELRITPAYPSTKNQALHAIQRANEYQESVFSRYYYICIFNFIPEPDQKIVIPDNSYIGDVLSIALAIFYGKRFENHGIIESYGHYWIPNYEPISLNSNHHISINNNQPRKDLEIPLSFKNCNAIIQFTLTSNFQHNKLHRYFFAAGKFYLNALQTMEKDIENAFLNLITCGEILSNFYDYSEDELYDEDLKKIFRELSLITQDSYIKQLKSRLYQVKRKFSLTVSRLLNKKFFTKTESDEENTQFQEDDIDKNIKAAYDIRSSYVHTGQSFKQYIEQTYSHINEVPRPYLEPNVEDKDLKKVLKKIPTFIGLERIMRYVLLRFLHTNGVYIHQDLNND